MLQEGAGGDRDGSCQSQLASEFLPAARQRALRLRSKKLLPGLRGPPQGSAAGAGQEGSLIPTLRFSSPSASPEAGRRDGWIDGHLGVAPPSQGREEAPGSLSPRRVAA